MTTARDLSLSNSKKVRGRKAYPNKILVGKEEFEIQFKRVIFDDEKYLGICDLEDNVIYLKKGQDPYELFKTLLHEYLHAIEKSDKIKIKHSLIYRLEKALANFLIQNFETLQKIIK